MQEDRLNEIIRKYKAGTATEEEKAFLECWYLQYQEQDDHYYDLQERLEDAEEVWGSLQKQIHQPKQFMYWPKIAAAILIVAFGSIYFLRKEISSVSDTQLVKQDVPPGGNRAVLVLGDGTKISLTDAKNGEIADQCGVEVKKSADGQLIYTIKDEQNSSEKLDSNIIETPKGGQFQIRLPDGSAIWLNASSSLKYPVSFNGAKERKVELKGEGYFEVAKDKTKPFIVTSGNQDVKVLGTHFNINAYKDEACVKTTLLEGSIQVSCEQNTELIRPGQQATLSNKHFKITSIDTQEAVAWKKGNFEFDNADIKTVMRQLSRWYDIEVSYDGELPDLHYSGSLPRNNNISVILNMLKKTGKINFKIDKKNVTICK